MANALYDLGRNEFAIGGVNWATQNISAVLIDTGQYTVNLAVDGNLASIPVIARIATAALAGKVAVAGVCDANDVTWPMVSGTTAEAVVLYKNTGVEATSVLLAYIDTATGLPITPNGSDIIIIWDNGVNKIFKL